MFNEQELDPSQFAVHEMIKKNLSDLSIRQNRLR